ncbi:MAG: hypothetical protein GQE15_27310 [Archangiaceae bacterium]|nr:hypothetical protein [Archangiaceae bacterium]
MRTLLFSLLLVGCDVATQQTRRTCPVEVVVTAPTAPLETGWTVTDLTGSMPLTEVRFFEGRVLVARWNPMELLISTAHAHPGHYQAGASMAEVLVPLELDLSKRDVLPWADANAVTGSYGSARLGFGTVRVRGTAVKADQTIRFDTGPLTLGKPLEGIRFEHEMDTSGGRVRLEVDKHGSTAGADGVITFDPASVAFNGFDRGVTDSGSYRFTWQPN